MIFNKSIVISLKSAEERRQRIIDQNINHQFFDAIDGSSMSDDEFRANVSNEGYDEYIKNDKKIQKHFETITKEDRNQYVTNFKIIQVQT